MQLETETIDKLFLELSQFTQAKTERELRYEKALKELANCEFNENNCDSLKVATCRVQIIARSALKMNFKTYASN